ncbi:hypothetical protein RclHR1_15040005 [Rhizophagus clarus]|uniref:Uncharacterized protein n=1 Tax=Rhizophagus clarus TaxID=94130 RepID=A0A2Z6QRQ4_9GLOM|nr:hypothetical protein RclHR1_15040005 [Rhizophagus clarus]
MLAYLYLRCYGKTFMLLSFGLDVKLWAGLRVLVFCLFAVVFVCFLSSLGMVLCSRIKITFTQRSCSVESYGGNWNRYS